MQTKMNNKLITSKIVTPDMCSITYESHYDPDYNLNYSNYNKLKQQYEMDHAADAMNYCINDMISAQLYVHKSITIKKVIFNNPATIVIWADGTKTVVKKSEDDDWDPEKGLAMAIVKRYFGSTAFIKKYTEEENNKIEDSNPIIIIDNITNSLGKKIMEAFSIGGKKS